MSGELGIPDETADDLYAKYFPPVQPPVAEPTADDVLYASYFPDPSEGHR